MWVIQIVSEEKGENWAMGTDILKGILLRENDTVKLIVSNADAGNKGSGHYENEGRGTNFRKNGGNRKNNNYGPKRWVR